MRTFILYSWGDNSSNIELKRSFDLDISFIRNMAWNHLQINNDVSSTVWALSWLPIAVDIDNLKEEAWTIRRANQTQFIYFMEH